MLTEWPPSRSSQSFVQRPVEQVLSDLKWLITSPVLIDPQANADLSAWLDDAFFEASWQRCSDRLSALSESSLGTLCGPPGKEGVSALLGTLCGYAGFTLHTERLGEYFEWLVCLWLYIDPAYSLVEKNIPVRLEDGSTLGELDFIIYDEEREKHIHLEVAVKFYLGVDHDLAASTDWHWRWFGPMQKDRLDLKYSHMQWRQMRHTEQPAVQQILAERGIEVDECWGMLKGRLYTSWQADSASPLSDRSLINLTPRR